jgi:hypothetical protein
MAIGLQIKLQCYLHLTFCIFFRLQHYDANFNFVSQEPVQQEHNTQFTMELPMPSLKKSDVDQYLALSNQKSQLKGEYLYKDRYLLSMQSNNPNFNNIFIETRCAEEMKNVSFIQ